MNMTDQVVPAAAAAAATANAEQKAVLSNEVSARVKLLAIRLISLRAAADPRGEEATYNVSLKRSASFSFDAKSKILTVTPSFSFRGESNNAERPADPIFVEVAFDLRYEIPDASGLGDVNFHEFANSNAIFNAWPYWRECLQNTLARMGLPPFVLPVLRVN